ncbi:MAG: polyphosphate polymerase domain-containing protein [Clostridiales bacterium]|nr:polyphosphate polymerase domain-containing protein [Clostridiales bacterium]
MKYTELFERYEMKFMLGKEQKALLIKAMDGHMRLDSYGRTTIRNIYFDTSDMRLIRTSLDKPVYKEKLRMRSYMRVGEDDMVFVEIKKKFSDVVYKRRLALPEKEAMLWLNREIERPLDTQIAKEIDYMLGYYGDLAPACFLSYEREAYEDMSGSDLRITLDENITARDRMMSLTLGAWGSRVMPPELTLLEIKSSGSYPMWLVRFLSDNGIRKTSFSKYGEYYSKVLLRKAEEHEMKGGLLYA